ncbi:MAG: hypothetical protein H5T92_01405 [Synergistales bacterium]|nr:hypothetical protein [Synergistales bacterium]
MKYRSGWLLGAKVLLVFVALASAFVLGVGFQAAKQISRVYHSRGRFAQVACLLRVYHKEHGSFPPARFRAVPGGPMHSWRVLVAQYIDDNHRRRFMRYDFSKPWDSPENLETLGGMTWFSVDGSTNMAHYLIIAEDDHWPAATPLRALLITEGEHRVLLVEYPDSDVIVTEPRY